MSQPSRLLFAAFLIAACGDPESPVVLSPLDTSGGSGTADASGGTGAPDVVELLRDTPGSTGGSDDVPDVADPPDLPEGCTTFGCACAEPGDCDSGFCVEGPDGRICTEICTDQCAEGFSCQMFQSGGGDPYFLCLPTHPRLCRPCRDDAECRVAGDDRSLCLPAADPNDGSFCGSSCEAGQACPKGYACAPVDLPGGGTSKQCQPTSGVCDCRDSWADLGLETDCAVSNAQGACPGVRTCGAFGLTSCEAAIPAAESCNGKDDDCDGVTDDLPATACTVENAFGACPGTTVCDGGATRCDGPTPAADACNGKDDDCDGVPDDGTCFDALECTDDVCSVDLGCKNPVRAGSCLIGGACFAAGAPNPADPCELCAPDKSATSWSDGDGLPCSDGDACTAGDTCTAGVCAGAPYACSSGLDCTTALCDGSGGCVAQVVAGFCAIEGVCHPDGAEKPSDPCRRCDAAANATEWSPSSGNACSDGNPCTHTDTCQSGTCAGTAYTCSDGLSCTADVCSGDGSCSYPLQDGCFLDGACVPAGARKTGSPCLACQPGVSTAEWTGASGGACDDGNACSSGDACQNGVCAGTPYSCNDSLACTSDVCDGAGGCQNPLAPGSCLIGGTCYAEGAANPGNVCETCASTAPSSWTGRSGVTCSDGDACTSSDTCSSGVCAGSPNVDSYESNPDRASATNLGNITDGSNYPKATFTASLYPGGDEDWFKFHDDDNAFALIYPRAEIQGLPAGVNYDLCVYYVCDSGGLDLTCSAGSKVTYAGMQGCCSTAGASSNENVTLDPDCNSTEDSGTAFIRVYSVSGAPTCGSYTVRWGDD